MVECKGITIHLPTKKHKSNNSNYQPTTLLFVTII